MNERRRLDPSVETELTQAVGDLHGEFAGFFSRETIAQVMADSHDSLGSYRVTTFIPLLAHRFARERLRAAVANTRLISDRPEVLFVCVHNSGRSQMAATLLEHHAHGHVTVRSAGSRPAGDIDPAVTEVMKEIDLDLTEQVPTPLTAESVQAADVMITLGCGDACPILLGKRYLDWPLQDPAGKDTAAVRRIRDDIDGRVQQLVTDLLPDTDTSSAARADVTPP